MNTTELWSRTVMKLLFKATMDSIRHLQMLYNRAIEAALAMI